jgi:hypothetical protein
MNTLPINPINFEDTINQPNVVQTIDGFPAVFYSAWNGQVKLLEWQNIPNRRPYDLLTTGGLLQVLSLLPGTTGTIILNDLSGSSTDSTSQNVVWISLETKKAMGSARNTSCLKYEYIKLSYSHI